MTDPRAYPQRYEGITGSDRSGDDLLALDAARRQVMMRMGYALWDSVLVASPAPRVRARYERMSEPQPGDLVMETSTWYRYRDDPERQIYSFGILLAERYEWATTDEEHAARVAEERELGFDDDITRRVEQAWYIQFGPEARHVYRWHNGSFICIDPDADDRDG